jgi:uncharacterized protein YaiE (UPF0345 family)
MTNDDYRMALLDIAHQLTLLATGEAPPIPVPMPEPDYPRVVTIAGAKFYAKAPINPAWEPSQYGKMFGKRMILGDPSNAPEGSPLRSPLGYPLHYGMDSVARVLYGESTFSSDAAVEAYRVAAAASQAGSEQRDQEQGNKFTVPGEAETEIKVEQG